MANSVINYEGSTYKKVGKVPLYARSTLPGLTNPYKDAGMLDTAINRLADSD